MPNQLSLIPPDAYQSFLNDLKQRIRTAQIKAALAVNKELILLYWQIGREILNRQEDEGWGSKVVAQLSKDLKREFPELKGFSRTNLLYMRSFAKAWPDEELVHQAGGLIPWKHNCVLIDKVKDPEARQWYIGKTIEHGWSRSVLTMQIETGLYGRQGSAVTNFERTLPKPKSDLTRQILGLFALPPEKVNSTLRQLRLRAERGLNSTRVLCHILLVQSIEGTLPC